MKNQLKKTVWI